MNATTLHIGFLRRGLRKNADNRQGALHGSVPLFSLPFAGLCSTVSNSHTRMTDTFKINSLARGA